MLWRNSRKAAIFKTKYGMDEKWLGSFWCQWYSTFGP